MQWSERTEDKHLPLRPSHHQYFREVRVARERLSYSKFVEGFPIVFQGLNLSGEDSFTELFLTADDVITTVILVPSQT